MGNCTDSIDKAKDKAALTHNLISTSYHEAGHTVYGLLHLMQVGSVQIFKEDDGFVGGVTNFNYFIENEVQDPELLGFIVYSEIGLRYAGLTAEKYHYKTISGSDKFPMFLKDGSSDDTLYAAKLIRQYDLAPPGKKRYLLKKQLVSEVLIDLQNNWNEVSLVAHDLFQRKRLHYSDLKTLLISKSENKKFWKTQFKEIDGIYKNYKKLDENDIKITLHRLGLL